MPKRDTEFSIRTKGLGDLNRALGKVDKDVRKDSVRKLREGAKGVRNTARPLTPVRRGVLQRSLRYSATNRGASVTSNLPQAPVHEYGGVIRPRGAPITIKKSRMLGTALQRERPKIEDAIERLVEQVIRREGFR